MSDGFPAVSVVLPVLEEETTIVAALDHLALLRPPVEVIVADGGSRDRTRALAAAHPAAPRVITQAGGRARQQNAAAAVAHGRLLVFLHADTRLPAGAGALLAATADRPGVRGGNFALRFDGPGAFPRVLGAVYAVQRRLGVFYGDSAIFVRRDAFAALGGFRPLPIMEDYDLARRLHRGGGVVCLPGPAVTSSRRWRRRGVTRTVAGWVVIRWLFLAGVPPRWLARLYRPVR